MTTFIFVSCYWTTENLKTGPCLSFLTLCSLCLAQYLTYIEGTHSSICWVRPMGYEASRLGPSDSSQGPGEIRKISHRDLWSKTHSMGEIQDLEGNNWMQRNLYFLICFYPVILLPEVLGRWSWCSIYRRLAHSDSTHSPLVGKAGKLKNHPY